MQNRKRILSVQIKRMMDDSPDTSYLGEYSNTADSEYSIDRTHTEDCSSLETINVFGKALLRRVLSRIEDMGLDNPEVSDAEDLVNQCLNECEECDCGERGDMGRHEYHYFNPSSNYSDCTTEEIRKYTREDYNRMERLNAGDWCYIGIGAEAQVQITSDVVQRIHSGGLWGIESDSDIDYIKSVEQDELASLKSELKALGFSSRAISQAFKSIKEVSE